MRLTRFKAQLIFTFSFAFFISLCSGGAYASDAKPSPFPSSGTAFLERGPLKVTGIPGIFQNAKGEVWYGQYRLNTAAFCELWAVGEDILITPDWKALAIKGVQSYSSIRSGRNYTALFSSTGYCVVFRSEGDSLPSSFLVAFEERFSYFFNNAKGSSILNLPAVVQFKGNEK